MITIPPSELDKYVAVFSSAGDRTIKVRIVGWDNEGDCLVPTNRGVAKARLQLVEGATFSHQDYLDPRFKSTHPKGDLIPIVES